LKTQEAASLPGEGSLRPLQREVTLVIPGNFVLIFI